MLKGAIIGLGNLELQYVDLIANHHESQLSSVCDLDKTKLEVYK